MSDRNQPLAQMSDKAREELYSIARGEPGCVSFADRFKALFGYWRLSGVPSGLLLWGVRLKMRDHEDDYPALCRDLVASFTDYFLGLTDEVPDD